MNAFGLTGTIGCGKSTVANLLSKYQDVSIFDCDRIAKEIISGTEHRKETANILEADVFPEGKVDFKAVAKIIFEKPEKKRLFEKLIHPLVWKAVQEKVDSTGNSQIYVVESAIIYETASEGRFLATIVAVCNPREQFRRLRENRHMTDADIRIRLGQQLPSSEKEKWAQFVIHTDCSLEHLKDRVSDLYQNLKQQKGVNYENTKSGLRGKP